MEKRIYLITEAFSSQPISLIVGNLYGGVNTKKEIARIELQSEMFPNKKIRLYYIGYDLKGNELFKYQEKSVNVHYFI